MTQTREAQARDQLKCWSRITRWRKVTDRPVPKKWLRHGEPPTSPSDMMRVCLDAYFSAERVDRIFTRLSPLYESLRST